MGPKESIVTVHVQILDRYFVGYYVNIKNVQQVIGIKQLS